MLSQGATGQTFAVGTEFFLAFSPERIDPGRSDNIVENAPKVAGGVTPAGRAVATARDRQATLRLAQGRLRPQAQGRVVPVSSIQAAKMVKQLSLRSEHLPRVQHRPGQRGGALRPPQHPSGSQSGRR
ncbi:MAG: hypothetical protein M5U01_41090 [Ardenticatenaceae bacterium]|nr:hypothetical protein [Ardenticatenaceae bacterium]